MKKIDFHVHTTSGTPVEDSIKHLKSMMAENGYCGVCVLSIFNNSENLDGDRSVENNKIALEIKKAIPGSYAFAALNHFSGVPFEEQIDTIIEKNFDGIKMLIGKPNRIKRFGYDITDKRFNAFYAKMEQLQMPIISHTGDPDISYDITKATPRMIEKGWVYDDTFATKEDCHKQVEHLLSKYPNLKIALAHMGFFADELDRLSSLMDKYPNLYMDITPALPIYKDLSQNPEKSREFFIKYQDRIFYGTDAESNLVGENLAYNRKKVKIVSHFLEGKEAKQIDDYTINPINLPQDVLEKIYYNNILNFCGEPK
jgi:predicted TIM-barrel fold metal-dependent hydrolase